MELLVVVIISSVVSAIVGYFIDEGSGALWGFFLGPIGWIIAAILKGKSAPEPYSAYRWRDEQEVKPRLVNTPPTSPPVKVETFDRAKWKVLKEVDAEIRSASEQVSKLDPNLDAVLAEKYLALNDKQYLQSLTDVVVQAFEKKKAEEEAIAATFTTEARESAERSKKFYEMSLGADRMAPETGTRVEGVEIYDGSWVNFKGGIRVILEDGRNMLMNKSMRRDFAPGDDKWK